MAIGCLSCKPINFLKGIFVSAIDSIILIMLVIGLIQGYRNGLLKSLVGMFGWLFALVLASFFAKSFSPVFLGFTDSPVLAVVMAFLAVALGVVIILQIILWLMQSTLKGLKLSVVDRLAGAGFACGKNLLVILLVLSVVAPFIRQKPMWQDSQIAQALLPLTPFALNLSKALAIEVKQGTDAGLQRLDKVTR